ncbi:unnamed protein product [Parascedosporium putredinis]|uniref:Uncharacterized protein n=1 Tax=Parascedosporium putredinis TaxID=1442378 RepID=A0A9P1H8F4_9PEZI|nr:unnamed protein product [Parascedosporium putredinis]CAI8002123.1 unnamed protein product [Parascedosporium putredinis]
MPRPPKANKDKAAVPLPVMPAVAPRAVEVENFIRVRDSTLGRLKTIQQLIKSFADDYLHCPSHHRRRSWQQRPKRAVQEEGQRRWATMGATEKQGWNQAYQYNLRLYNARVHSYKNGNPEAKNMDDQEALKYADEFSIPIPVSDENAANEQDAIAEQLKGTSADAHGETNDAADEPDATPRAPATPASPAQKRRRTSSKPTEDEPKKSGRKKAGKNA